MIRLLLAVPALLLVVLFALSNKHSVRVVMWPTDYAVETPLSLLVLAAGGLALLIGALLAWGSSLPAKRRARRAESAVRSLEAQVAGLRAQIAQDRGALPALPPPA